MVVVVWCGGVVVWRCGGVVEVVAWWWWCGGVVVARCWEREVEKVLAWLYLKLLKQRNYALHVFFRVKFNYQSVCCSISIDSNRLLV
jgi:hypothetical protein